MNPARRAEGQCSVFRCGGRIFTMKVMKFMKDGGWGRKAWSEGSDQFPALTSRSSRMRQVWRRSGVRSVSASRFRMMGDCTM